MFSMKPIQNEVSFLIKIFLLLCIFKMHAFIQTQLGGGRGSSWFRCIDFFCSHLDLIDLLNISLFDILPLVILIGFRWLAVFH